MKEMYKSDSQDVNVNGLGSSKNTRMQAVKSEDTKVEKILGSALWKVGLRYRKHSKYVLGKPDFIFRRQKIAIFCDSEFWHAKELDKTIKTLKKNKEFWIKKLTRNAERDVEVTKGLSNDGWIVLRFWSKNIYQNLDVCVKTVKDAYELKNQVNDKKTKCD